MANASKTGTEAPLAAPEKSRRPAARSSDGRHARAQRTHDAVLDGLQECLEAGIPQPTAKQIAAQAGVSLRGIFRHFENLDALLLELDKREHERIASSIRSCPLDAPLEQRITSFLRGCARVYEGTAAVRRALQASLCTSGRLARHRDRQRIIARQKVQTVFAEELRQLSPTALRERVHAISALTSWSQWEEMRSHEGLSLERTQRVLGNQLHRLLVQPTDPSDLLTEAAELETPPEATGSGVNAPDA